MNDSREQRWRREHGASVELEKRLRDKGDGLAVVAEDTQDVHEK